MAIRNIKEKSRCIEIDLTGPEGNAFVLLAYASRFCRQLGYDKHKTDLILDEMRLTDYEGLVYTFNHEFGSFVTLWR
jgi:hypothetical protein